MSKLNKERGKTHLARNESNLWKMRFYEMRAQRDELRIKLKELQGKSQAF